MDESFKDALDSYSRLAREQDLDREQKTDLFYKCLDGNALKFYRDHVESKYADYGSRMAVMTEKYSSKCLQDGNKAKLETLRLENVCKTFKLGAMEALEKIYEIISTSEEDLPTEYRSQAHLVGFYKDAVLAHDFATGPIERLDADALSLHEFHASLVKALTLYNQRLRAKGLEPLSFTAAGPARFVPSAAEQSSATVHSAHFGRYQVQKQSNNQYNRANHRFANQRRAAGPCFNCGGPHTISKCNQKIDYRQAAENRLEFFRKLREKMNMTGTDAIRFMQDCYFELADAAEEISAERQGESRGREEMSAEENDNLDFGNMDETLLTNYYTSLRDNSSKHENTNGAHDYDF